jgi:hypothetical protein
MRLARRSFAFLLWCAGMALIAVPRQGNAQCPEEPTVLMDEQTASSHLMARRDAVLPEALRERDRVWDVVLLVTVDRQGRICAARPVAGRVSLREAAEKVVKSHWRFRPFVVNWKPVVVQFPVTVRFMPAQREEPRWVIASRPGSPRARVPALDS